MSMPNTQPSRSLYNKVRGGFIAQGISLSKWCACNGRNLQNVQCALIGTWNGPKAKVLRSELITASGITRPFIQSENHSSPVRPAATGAPEFFYWGC